jgi:hypothetical protein
MSPSTKLCASTQLQPALPLLKYNIVALQEIWAQTDYENFAANVGKLVTSFLGRSLARFRCREGQLATLGQILARYIFPFSK